MTTYRYLPLAISLVLSQMAFADSSKEEPSVLLDNMSVMLSTTPQSLAFSDATKASDLTIKKDKLQHRSATLGNALSSQGGIHSNPFGGGASAPVVRGQEGVRVKVLQNGMGVSDMSTVSPDHAVAVDTLLASRVEVVRGASTLMYANASTAGVVNVIDERILDTMPNAITGELMLRTNDGSDEKLATAGVSLPVGEKIAVRIEGMSRAANPYNVPAINFGEVLNYLPDSHNKSVVGTLGVSYIGNQGHLGVAYSQRKDDYGLVGHNHKFDNCAGHVLDTSRGWFGPERKYLIPYPHLMTDEDMVGRLHFHCGSDYDLDHGHSHDNVYGHRHDPSQKGPWVELSSKTFSLQGELNSPTPSIDKVRLSASHSDYHHQEYDEGKHIPDPSTGTRFVKGNTAYWANKGLAAKMSVRQSPTDRLSLVWGVETASNKTHALIPSHDEKAANRRPLVENTQKTGSVFALGEYQFGKTKWHVGVRHEKTSIPVHYNIAEIDAQFNNAIDVQEKPDLTPYRNNATSYAVGAMWDISPKLRLDATLSHNERIPTPMELYYHGKHLATNSFLYGNNALKKEKSDNGELGVTFTGDKWHLKGSVYANHFGNFIHPENLYKNGNLTMRRFTQSKAKLRGAELELSYQFSPNLTVSVFGDTVRGKLYRFSPIVGNGIYEDVTVYVDPKECGVDRDDPNYEDWCKDTERKLVGQDIIIRPDRNPPRLSPDRFGLRINGEYGRFSPSLEYVRVAAQNRTSQSIASKYYSECPHHDHADSRLCPIYINEDATLGYHLLNLGLDHHRRIGNTDTTWSLRANNLLNEKIYVHNSFLPFVPQQGRNVSLSVNVKF